MVLTYQKIQRRGEPCIEITGCQGDPRILVLPGELEGLPVRRIGGHAFEGQASLREVSLPDTVRDLASFAFYNCRSLYRIRLFDSIEDYRDGVIRQCPALREIEVTFREKDHYEVVRDLLADSDRMLGFLFHLPDGDVRLTFPPYFDSYHEDTMARAIHHSVNGAGLGFRECVTRRAIDYKGYDRQFRFVVYDSYEAAVSIAFDRLMYPRGLSPVYEEAYIRYLTETADQVLSLLMEKKDTDRILFMADRMMIPREVLPGALQEAGRRGLAEVSAILMDYQRRHFSGHAGQMTFSLDDF